MSEKTNLKTPGLTVDFKITLRRLIGYFARYKGFVFTGIICAVVGTLLNITAPFISGNVITELSKAVDVGQGVDFPVVFRLVLLLACLYGGFVVLNATAVFCITTGLQSVLFSLRQDIQGKLAHLPLRYYDSHPYGDILSRVTNDVDTIAFSLQQSLMQVMTIVVQIVGVFFFMLYISPKLTLVALLTIPFTVLLSQTIVKRAQKFFIGQQRSLGEVSGYVEEIYGGFDVIKLYGKEADAQKGFEEVNETLYRYAFQANFASGTMAPLVRFISNLGYVAVSIGGCLMVISGSLDIGYIQSFIKYMRQFTMPLNQMAEMANSLQSALAASERIFLLLDEPEISKDPEAPEILENVEGRVAFDHVRFGYKKDQPIIHDLTFTADPGSTVAIVGPTGAGKTTLINLLMRFYDIDSGSIAIDGLDTRKMSRAEVRRHTGMVLQDAWLFGGTIRDNIAYGKLTATQAEIEEAAKIACADHFIRTLPEGYDTIIDEEADNVSQGQRQLITIARAVVADPKILILDEATSSVDTRTEVLIQKGMTNVMKERTSFVIAHRLSTIRDANLILVMNRGDIVEQGTHDELLEKGGFYAKLYNSQFAGGGSVDEAMEEMNQSSENKD